MANFLDLNGLQIFWLRFKNFLFHNPAKYVIERNITSDGWHYIKWSDGTVEGWYHDYIIMLNQQIAYCKNIPTPVLMADNQYNIILNIPSYGMDTQYSSNRTTSSFDVAAGCTLADPATQNDPWIPQLYIYLCGRYA